MRIKEIQNFNPYDLIKFLNQEARKDYQYNDKKDFFNAGVAFMLACVRKYFNDSFDIPIRDNNGWISVDDELPKQEQIVRAYNPHWREKYNHMTFIFFNGDFVSYPYMYKVEQPTHWQPLSPLPPKE